jgi:membrane protein implicated in regulation of membrane protease activity
MKKQKQPETVGERFMKQQKRIIASAVFYIVAMGVAIFSFILMNLDYRGINNESVWLLVIAVAFLVLARRAQNRIERKSAEEYVKDYNRPDKNI